MRWGTLLGICELIALLLYLVAAGSASAEAPYPSERPANDDFKEAQALANPLTGRPDTSLILTGPGLSTVGATKEPGEPAHAGNGGGASVWFSWTAPEAGSVYLTVCQTAFAPLLAIYTGSQVDALTPVASNDGSPGQECADGPGETGAVGFNTQAGVVYMIAVDGRDGASGTFGFSLREFEQPLPPAAPPSVPSVPAPVATVVSPGTMISHRAIKPEARTASFSLNSDEAKATFRCKLDGRSYMHCGANVTYKHLAPGRHVFRAEAVAPSGLTDQSPAIATFRIAPPAPRHQH